MYLGDFPAADPLRIHRGGHFPGKQGANIIGATFDKRPGLR